MPNRSSKLVDDASPLLRKPIFLHQQAAEKYPEISQKEVKDKYYPWGDKRKLFYTSATETQLKQLGMFRWLINGLVIWGFSSAPTRNKHK